MNRRLWWSVAGTIFFALLVAAWFLLKPEERPGAIRIGYLGAAATAPLFVATDQGLFERHGITVELIEFRTSNEIAAAAVSGQIDVVGIGATNAVLDAATATDTPFELFLVNNYVKRGNLRSSDFLIARSGITDFSELRGRTVAFMPGSVGRVFAQEIFRRRGIPLDDIQYVELSPPQWMPALQAGQIDAVTAIEPFATIIMENLDVNVLVDGYYAEVMPNAPVSGAWFVAGRLERDQERAIVAAYRDTLALMRENPLLAREALVRYTRVDQRYAPLLRMNEWSLVTEGSTRQSARAFAELFARNGGIRRIPTRRWLWQPQ